MFFSSLILLEFSYCKWLGLSLECCSEVFYRPISLCLPYFSSDILFICLPINILATLSNLTLTVARVYTFFYKKGLDFFLWWELRRVPKLPQYLFSSLKAFFLFDFFCFVLLQSIRQQPESQVHLPSTAWAIWFPFVLAFMCFTVKLGGLVRYAPF